MQHLLGHATPPALKLCVTSAINSWGSRVAYKNVKSNRTNSKILFRERVLSAPGQVFSGGSAAAAESVWLGRQWECVVPEIDFNNLFKQREDEEH